MARKNREKVYSPRLYISLKEFAEYGWSVLLPVYCWDGKIWRQSGTGLIIPKSEIPDDLDYLSLPIK